MNRQQIEAAARLTSEEDFGMSDGPFMAGFRAGAEYATAWTEITPATMPADNVPLELTDGRHLWLGAFAWDIGEEATLLFTISDPEWLDGKWRADLDDYDDREPTHFRELPTLGDAT